MDGNTTHIRIEVGGSVLDLSLIGPAQPVTHRPPPSPSPGLESIWPMHLVVGLRERLLRQEKPWERTTRWRIA